MGSRLGSACRALASRRRRPSLSRHGRRHLHWQLEKLNDNYPGMRRGEPGYGAAD